MLTATKKFLRRSSYLALLLLLCSSCSSYYADKEIKHVSNPRSKYQSSSFVFPQKSTDLIEIECTKNSLGNCIFLNIHSGRFTSDSPFSQLVCVKLETKDRIYSQKLPVLEGEMRLELSDELKEILKNCLFEEKDFIIKVSHHKTLVESSLVAKKFKSFLKSTDKKVNKFVEKIAKKSQLELLI